MTVDKKIFYDPSRLLSYNSFLNFVVGSRGVGKTYGFIKFCIQRFLKTGEQFIYTRRYATELETSVPKFFDPYLNCDEFRAVEFKVRKSKKLSIFYINGNVAGYAVALSTALVLKSTSFTNVKNIIFDEFIIDKGTYHYIGGSGEPAKFIDLVETIFRLRDGRVFLLGNAITITNPYFEYFNLKLGYKTDFKVCKRDKNGEPLILVNYISNPEYEETKSNTRFGQLVQGTSYGDYAVNNKWYLDDNMFVEKRDPNSYCVSVFIVNGVSYGLWLCRKTGIRTLCKDFDPGNPCRFACDNKSHSLETTLQNARKNTWFMIMVRLYQVGMLRFESVAIKSVFLRLIEQVIGC